MIVDAKKHVIAKWIGPQLAGFVKLDCRFTGYPWKAKNIGTKIGAIKAHFAAAEPINKSRTIAVKTNAIIKNTPPTSKFFKNSAPLTAIMTPKFDHAKKAINCAAKNAITI